MAAAKRPKPVFGQKLGKYMVYHLCGCPYTVVDTPNGRAFIGAMPAAGAATCRCGAALDADRLLTEAEVVPQFAPAHVPAYLTPLTAAIHAMSRAEYQTRGRDAYHRCGQRFKIDLAFDARPPRFVRTYGQAGYDPVWTICPRCQRRIAITNVTPADVIKARFATEPTEPLSKAVKRWQRWRRRGVYAPRPVKWYERIPGVNWDVATQQPIG
ncbi:MAG: hypothetical protein M3R24_28625 [Chloroflexota bacterium]|nr:hypothetical protein [Chloroflexota bacterium]